MEKEEQSGVIRTQVLKHLLEEERAKEEGTKEMSREKWLLEKR